MSVRVALDNQFAAREYVDGFLNLRQQFEISGFELRRSAVERQADKP